MHIDERILNDTAILSLRGELLNEEDNGALRQKVTSLIVDGITKIVIDLGRVNRINSQGLSALIAAVNTVRESGGDIRFAQIDRHIHSIFVETKLVQVFRTYETVGRAMASYMH
jgi:anti-sigma B factor antagonist